MTKSCYTPDKLDLVKDDSDAITGVSVNRDSDLVCKTDENGNDVGVAYISTIKFNSHSQVPQKKKKLMQVLHVVIIR